MKIVPRREFLKKTSLATVTVPFASLDQQDSTSSKHPLDSIPTEGPTKVYWLEGGRPAIQAGKSFGVPWPQGEHPVGTRFDLRTAAGDKIPMQTWTTATWPDGSLKWTGHAVAPDAPSEEYYEIIAGEPASHPTPIQVKEESEHVLIDTGIVQCTFPRDGSILISSISRNGNTVVQDGILTGTRQDKPERGASTEAFTSTLDLVEIEQAGPIRAVVKAQGNHLTAEGREWLPFIVRFYLFAGSPEIRMTHTFVYDGDEHHDFISSLGVRFNMMMYDEHYNRHIRFAGQDKGIWAEAVQGLTGLRRDPGKEVREAQTEGKRVPNITTWNKRVSARIHWVPTWADFTLTQFNANGFTIKKRTKAGHAWIKADEGGRSNGLGYIGGASAGVVFGMRDFWKLHPTQMDIRNAASPAAEVTLWLWSPEVPPMDIRFYHDGLAQDMEGPLTDLDVEGIQSSVPDHPYAKQLDALEITYEDYENGFGTPHGIARSTDITLRVVDSTPSNQELATFAAEISLPVQLVPRPVDLKRAKVFGTMWDLPNHSSEAHMEIESQLSWFIQYYKSQVEQHHWYGFWDYGDVMHTYDQDRHVWRYDIGGYAWDNSELSTDLMLWYTYLRSGNPDAFRLAEAMNRHNRDVDIYHLGRFAGLGTRHNVQHWGCSAKQLRISTAANRRFHYYLTTDERTGDVLQEVAEADRRIASLDAHRKVYLFGRNPTFAKADTSKRCRLSSGTDYGAVLANWLTAWERTGEAKYGKWIEASMRSIGQSKWGFFTDSFWFDPDTKELTEPEGISPTAEHLKIMFGLPEILSEVIQLVDIPDFDNAWLSYCRLWNASEEQMQEELGQIIRKPSFASAHSRLTAYASFKLKDDRLAQRAAVEFNSSNWREQNKRITVPLSGPEVLNEVDEASWVSTNNMAQWGLAAIQTIALVPDALSKR
ncbi:MAG: hypothetical protein KTR24_03930 [Saprospiraceae bacterium]|nr:hypothetical protein [Saprospiraceae bacterium]